MPPTFDFCKTSSLVVAPGVPCEVEVARASDFGKNVWDTQLPLALEKRRRMKVVVVGGILRKVLLSQVIKCNQYIR